MAELVYKNCKLYVGGYDLSGSHNELSLAYGADMLDKTAFGTSSRQRRAGLKNVECSHSGFWEGGDNNVDDVLFDNLSLPNQVMTVCPTDGSFGEVAFTFQNVIGEYSPGGNIGELMRFNFAAYGEGDLVRGTVMETGTKTASGNGTARQLGAVQSGQKLYAALHVIAVSGTTPSLTVVVQSDDTSDFLSPTDRITFAAATAIGAFQLYHLWN